MLGSFPYCKPAMFLCPWGFSRQEYWSGLPCPLPGDLPNPGLPHFRYFLSSLEIFDVSTWILVFKCFPGGAEVKASGCNVGDLDSIPGSGRSHGEGNGNPLQYACLENSMHRGACGLHFMGSQRVGHNWATNIFTFQLPPEASTQQIPSLGPSLFLTDSSLMSSPPGSLSWLHLTHPIGLFLSYVQQHSML